MIWKKCKLYQNQKIGIDALRNPVYEKKKVLETICRFTPWTDLQIALKNRNVTKNEQRFVIPVPFCEFPKCNFAEIDGIMQEITEVTSLSPRYTAILVKAYKE